MTATLEDVCIITMGQAPSGDSYNDKGEGLPLIAGAGDFKGDQIVPKKFTTQPGKVSIAGDIVLSIRASIGAKVWADGEYCLGRGVAGLRPTSELDRGYLWHWLTYFERALAAKGRGATFLQVNRGDIGEIPIDLPRLEKQRRIAAILDHTDALRAKRRQVLAYLDTLTQSIFHDMFGDAVSNSRQWMKVNLGDRMTLHQYGPRFHDEAYTDDGVRIVRITDLASTGTLNFGAMPRLPVSADNRNKFGLENGDILFARTGATVGKVALIRDGDPECIAGAYFIRMQFAEDVDAIYVSTLLRTESIQAIVWAGSHQSAQQNFSGPGLRALPLIIPPIELQRAFAARVNAIIARRTAIERALTADDELFASLQSRAFRGEL